MSTHVENTDRALLIAEVAVQSIKQRLVSIAFIDSGSTSEVYRVKSSTSEYVLKIAKTHPRKTTSYLSDFAIRKALSKSGLPVAKPIATDSSTSSTIATNWALDSYCHGKHPERGAIPSTISKQLGVLLRELHDLPAEGFGSLENTDLYFQGQCNGPIEGLLSRFDSPWPFSKKSLNSHPSVHAAPSLLGRLSALEEILKRFPSSGTSVVVHGDLHEGQLLEHQHNLVALLDFNEAMIGRPEWDLGSYYYFHGRDCLRDLLECYTEDANARTHFFNDALSAAILIALHHGNRGEILGKPHRIAASVQFLERNLPDAF